MHGFDVTRIVADGGSIPPTSTKNQNNMSNLTLPNGFATKLPAPSFSLEWKDQGNIVTRQGSRHLYTANLVPAFWDYWKAHKQSLKSHGVSCNKNDKGQWQVMLWLLPASPANGAEMRGAAYDKALIPLSRSDKPSEAFTPMVPDGVTPYGYQCAGVEYALRIPRCIIGDDMGLGKTLQAIMVCNHTKARSVLVVCPASLRLNWCDEWAKFATITTSNAGQVVTPILKQSDIAQIASSDVVMISYELMANAKAQKALRSRVWDCVIADEAHYLKNKDTKRSSGLLGLPPRSRGSGPKEPIPSKRYLLLTGTPVSNRPSDFWNLLRFCSPDQFGAWTKFAMRYCNAKRVPFGGGGLDASGSSNLEELQALVRGTCMVRRLKSQVLKQLPAKTRKVVALPAPEDVRKSIDALTLQVRTSEETVEKLREAVAEAQTAGNAEGLKQVTDQLRAAEQSLFTETSKIRKAIGLAKVDLAIDHIVDSLGSTSQKVIVGAHHKEVVAQLRGRLAKYSPAVVTGDVDPTKRHEEVQRFQSDPACRLFIGNILAAGTGLTLTSSAHVIIVEPDWVPANNAQFEDRAHRIGQSNPVLIEYLAMDKTIDVQILKSNARKMDVTERATDKMSHYEEDPSQIDLGSRSPVQPMRPVAEKEAEDSERQRKRMLAAKFGQSLSPRELIAAHACVRHVHALDGDRASAQNGVGFNKMDTDFGARLAATRTDDLSDFMKGRLAALAWKYRRQCPDQYVTQLKAVTKKTVQQP